MHKLPKPSAVERVAGSLAIEVVGTMLGAWTGGVFAPLLPILAKSIASTRQKERIEAYLIAVGTILEEHKAQLEKLSDSQYKVKNEAIAAAFQTTHDAKLLFLQHAVRNALFTKDLEPNEATVLSRVLRDISAEEAFFVVKHFGRQFVHISSEANDSTEVLTVPSDTRDARTVGSLVALGLLVVGEPTFGQQLRFSATAAKLIVLLRDAA